MRLVRVSLAAKYRMLFGAAVALIIGAALFVPWYQMEAMLLELPFREAQRAADDYFRLVMPIPGAPSAAVAGVHGQDFGLFPDRLSHQPQFVRLDPKADDPTSFLNQGDNTPFVREALRTFRKQPKREFTYLTRSEASGRVFYYAHAVRAAKSCLDCHDEGKTARPYRENELAGVITVVLPADLSSWELVLNRAWIIAAGALAGILAILVFYLITHRFILAPIQELSGVAIRVSEGDLDVRSTLRTGDEFEQLSVNLNHMLERLRASQDELRKANRLLDEKLGEMAETNVALYEANRVKSEFLANVSHELRTPLTSIIGFAELLREGPRSEINAKTARYAENILISGRILLEIINDLLDLAKIEAGKIELHPEEFDVRGLCATLLDFLRPLADKKSLRLELESDDELPLMHCDRGRLRQVLFNLLSNAIKFTPESGQVRMSARAVEKPRTPGRPEIRIEVSDTGPGIAPEHHALIFDKFRQIDQSETREHPGTGLGLAIARELVQLLGGQIGVISVPGQGACFWVELPIVAPETAERPAVSLV